MTALNATTTAYYVTIDADTFLDDESFMKLIQPIYRHSDIVGVGAAVRIRNGCSTVKNALSTASFPQNTLPLLQTLEYMRSFLQRDGWNYLGGNFVIAGAFSIFKTDAVLAINGYVDTIAEDMEIAVRLHRFMRIKKRAYKIIYRPDPVAWTEAPDTLRDLARQRKHWQRGLIHYGFISRCAIRSIWTFWLFYLSLLYCRRSDRAFDGDPEGQSMLFVGLSSASFMSIFVLLFMLVTLGFNILFTALCIVIEEFSYHKYPRLRSLFFLFIFNVIDIVYRQLLLVWRIKGTMDFFKSFKKYKRFPPRSIKTL
jgi:cellulose synthase/poly-beta-1,6-N-acetylglucosamine synthase-like glycosyltransferase